jgi:hypothetical protein
MQVQRKLPPKRRSPRVRSEARPAQQPTGPLPIEDIYPLYPGEWVAVKVTALDKHQRISHGEVLAHSASRKKVSKALLQAHRDDPGVHTYLFVGGPRLTVEAWREQLAEAAGALKDYFHIPTLRLVLEDP